MNEWKNGSRVQTELILLNITCFLMLLAVLFPQPLYGEFDNSQLIEDAQKGDSEAQYTLAHLLLKGQGGVARDVRSAVTWFEMSSERGHKDAPFDLAMLYLNGVQVSKDNTKALYWLHQAADAGNSEAQYYLAQIYRASDLEQAVIWLKQAAEAGHQMASKDLKAWCADMPIVCEGSRSSDN